MTDSTPSLEAEVRALRREVEAYRPIRDAIHCIARHARGCDRHHDSADHFLVRRGRYGRARFCNCSGPGIRQLANASHASTSLTHTHNVTTHLCEIEGDVAHAESYVIVVLLGRNGKTAQFISGRYLDRLERRDGAWRIAVRRSRSKSCLLRTHQCSRRHSSKRGATSEGPGITGTFPTSDL